MRLTRDDRGVTLPEVLVAVVILAIIIVPLADALIGFIRNTDATTRRMNESHDVQLASTYFARDIQNLGVRNWGSPTLDLKQSIGNASYPCGADPVASIVISLAYDDPTSASLSPVDIRITYVVRDVNGEHQLRRLQCRQSSTVVSDVAVVHNLFGRPLGPFCDPTPCTGAGPGVPRKVTITLKVKDPASPTEVPVTLTGYRGQT
jgi:prepilin-type N-terminal cleavage/methylation domain-containing protein